MDAVHIRVYRARAEAPQVEGEHGEDGQLIEQEERQQVAAAEEDEEEEQCLDVEMPPSSTIYHLKCIICDSWQMSPLCQTITMEVEADDPRVPVTPQPTSPAASNGRTRRRSLGLEVEVKKPPVQLVLPEGTTVGSCRHGLQKEVLLSLSFSWHAATACLVDPDADLVQAALRALSQATGESDREMCANAIANADVLKSRNLALRVTAVEVLQRIAPAASSNSDLDVVSLLVPLLEDWEEPMRLAVEEALVHLVQPKNKAAFSGIRKRLKFFKAGVRVAALRTLARVVPMGELPVITDVCKLIEDPDTQVRAQALKTLVAIAKKGEEAAFKELAIRLSTKFSTEVRLTALTAFIRLTVKGDEKAVDILAKFLLADPIPDFRQHAAEGLAEVSPPACPASIKAWICCLGRMALIPGAMEHPKSKKKRRNKESSEDGEEAPNLPGQVEEDAEDIVDDLAPQEEEEGESSSEEELPPIVAAEMDDHWRVRLACVEGLSSLAQKQDKTVLHVLADVLSGDEDGQVRRAALDAFVKVAGPMGDSFSVGLMIEQLEHEVGDVRHLSMSAIRQLGRQGDEATIGALVKAMKDPSSEVRKAAVEALPGIANRGTDKVIRAVVSLLEDAFADVRLAALTALPLVSVKGDKTHAAAVGQRLQDIDRRVQVEAHKLLSSE